FSFRSISAAAAQIASVFCAWFNSAIAMPSAGVPRWISCAISRSISCLNITLPLFERDEPQADVGDLVAQCGVLGPQSIVLAREPRGFVGRHFVLLLPLTDRTVLALKDVRHPAVLDCPHHVVVSLTDRASRGDV